ncbi:hypothetical protein OpiT1DRAFT_02579 [Opitutaceae bacterium TAV1]|nr:hypothetical protein OpiT1DRAFT_02579 [Opitutaceae bacterium TAV1]
MPNRNYLPRADAALEAWLRVFITALGTMLTRAGVPTDVYNHLQEQADEWFAALAAATNPATRTKATIDTKNALREALEAEVRALVKRYLNDANTNVTVADRDNLGLPIHKTTHTPVPIPAQYPDFFLDTSILRQLTIHFHEHGKKSSAKPFGVHGAEIAWAILDAPPGSVDDLIRSRFDTHSPFTLAFDESQRGKTVYFCLRWENTRGEKGPWSPIVSAIVP